MGARVFFVKIALLTLFFGCLGGASYAAIIKIGALFDLSGPNRRCGDAMLQGASWAVKTFNQELRPMGQRLQLVAVDTASEEGRLLLGAMRLTKKKHTTVLVGPTSPELPRTLVGFGEAHETPVIVTSGTLVLRPTPWHRIKWSFGVSPGIDVLIKGLFKHLKAQRTQKIGLLVENTREFNDDIPWFRAYGIEYGIKIVAIEGFSPWDTECATQLQHIKDLGAKIIIYRGGTRFIPTLFNSLKGMELKAAFLMDTPLEQSDLKGAPEGVSILWEAPLLFSPGSRSAPQHLDIIRFKGFLETTSIRSRPEILCAARGWDAMGIIAEAIKKGASPDKHGIIKVLQGRRAGKFRILLNYNGLTGHFRPSRQDHTGLDPDDLSLINLK